MSMRHYELKSLIHYSACNAIAPFVPEGQSTPTFPPYEESCPYLAKLFGISTPKKPSPKNFSFEQAFNEQLARQNKPKEE